MSVDNKFKITSGNNSRNYQAAGDIKQHFGNIIQTIAQTRLGKLAAVMTIVAGVVAVAQYVSSLPANFKLSGVSLRYNQQFGENDFNLVMQNQGPDNIRNLVWYAWLEGTSFTLKNTLRGSKSVVARGDMYVAEHVGEGKLSPDVNYEAIKKARRVSLCLVYDGPLPGTKQWMLLNGTNQAVGGYYSGSLNGVGGVPLTTTDTGGGLSFFASRCG